MPARTALPLMLAVLLATLSWGLASAAEDREQRLRNIAAAALVASRMGGIDPAVAMALVVVESSGRAGAVSNKNALGLTQVLPSTAVEIGVLQPEMLLERPEISLAAGLAYLKQNVERFDGDLARALAAYYAGPTRVAAHGGVPPVARGYVLKVVTTARRIRACPTPAQVLECLP